MGVPKTWINVKKLGRGLLDEQIYQEELIFERFIAAMLEGTKNSFYQFLQHGCHVFVILIL